MPHSEKIAQVTTLVRSVWLAVLCATAAEAAPRVTFVRRVDLSAGAMPVAVVAADLDADGRLDLAVANFDSGDVSLFWGVGDGTFVAAPAALAVGPLGTESPVGLAVADVTGDGIPDIVTANQFSNTVSVLPNLGARMFGLAVESVTGGSPEGLIVADVNGDGILDVLTPNSLDDTVAVLPGRGDGSFASTCSNLSTRTCRSSSDCPPGGMCGPYAIPVGAEPKALAVRDLDGDGNADLIVALALSGDPEFVSSLMVLRGLGNGNFLPQPEIDSSTFDFGWAVTLASADINGDHTADVVVSNANGDSISVLAGKGGLGFDRAVAAILGGGTGPEGLLVADLNGDGAKDIATSGSFQDKVFVLAGFGNGTFAAPQEFSLAAGALPAGMAQGDFNRDRRIDLAVANMQNNTVTILVNPCSGDCGLNGSVTVDEVLTMVNIGLGNRSVSECLGGDLNGDGEITVDEILTAVNSALLGCAA
jgi:hypothetical protein